MRKTIEILTGIEQSLTRKALHVLETANSFSPLDNYPLLKTSKRIIWDTIINKPSVLLVDSRKRLDALRSVGIGDERIVKLIIAHAIADMTIPLALMWIINPLVREIQNLPLFGELGATYVIARAGYGVVAGLGRELTYSLLPDPNAHQELNS